VRRLYISFKSLVNDFVYNFGRAALLLLVEVWNHTVPVWERRRIRVNHFNSALQVSGDVKTLISTAIVVRFFSDMCNKITSTSIYHSCVHKSEVSLNTSYFNMCSLW
jgi:hypothetical protein